MRFAHIADCHIGAWREERLKNLNTEAFLKAMQICIEKDVDFILIAGDLFNTSLPSVDNLKEVVGKLKEVRDNGIHTYMIAGSHDFSPSGKTILDVLEKADLIKNVFRGEVKDNKLKLRFTTNEKTGIKITGIIGKKGMLDKRHYEDLDKEALEAEQGKKIFMFHTALEEYKPEGLEKMEAMSFHNLPKAFDYYAGGHVHYVFDKNEPGYGLIVYPGALSPTNFKELEKGGNGFYIVDSGKLQFENVQTYNVFSIKINCNDKTPEDVEAEIKKQIEGHEFMDTIVTLRLKGCLKQGKPADINFKSIFEILYAKSAHFVMKNTSALTSREFEEMQVNAEPSETVEEDLIKENAGKVPLLGMDKEKEMQLTVKLMQTLSQEKQEGETNAVFEERIKKDLDSLFRELELI